MSEQKPTEYVWVRTEAYETSYGTADTKIVGIYREREAAAADLLATGKYRLPDRSDAHTDPDYEQWEARRGWLDAYLEKWYWIEARQRYEPEHDIARY